MACCGFRERAACTFLGNVLVIAFMTFIVPSFQSQWPRCTYSTISCTPCLHIGRAGHSYLRSCSTTFSDLNLSYVSALLELKKMFVCSGGNEEEVNVTLQSEDTASTAVSRVREEVRLQSSQEDKTSQENYVISQPQRISGLDYGGCECSMRSIRKLAFVDRYDEVLAVARLNLKNQRNIVSGFSLYDKPCLVTAGQLFGAGKTELGSHAVELVRNNPDLRSNLAVFNEVNHTRQFGEKTLLYGYLNAEYIPIDLSRFSCLRVSFDIYIAFVLFQALCNALENRTVIYLAEMLELGLEGVRNVVQHFQVRHPGTTLFLHWDEVGILETQSYTDTFQWSKSCSLQSRMERYCSFWQILTPLLSTEGVYLYVSGKTPAFSLIGLGLMRKITPPSKSEHIVIGSLTPEFIIEAFQKSNLDDGTALKDLIKVPNNLLQRFGETVYACTAGLPRLTSEAFEALCRLQQQPLVLDSEAKILNALELSYSNLRDTIPIPCFYGHAELAEIFLAFLTMSLLGQAVDKSAIIALSGSRRMLHVLRAIDQFNINIDLPNRGDRWNRSKAQMKLRFSQWNVRAMLEMTGIQDVRIPFLYPLLSVGHLLDRGAPLEMLLRMVICFSLSTGSLLSRGETWGCRYHFFKDTMIENNVLRINQTQPISFVPAVGSKNITLLSEMDYCQMSLSPAQVWRYKMNPADWSACNKVLIAQSSVIHPGPQSASPDLGFSGLESEDSWVYFACKFNAVESQIGWTTIQSEINKTKPLLAVKRTCLVIVALNLDGSILDMLQSMGSSRLVVTSAMNIGGLNVPENMEVIILGPIALQAFIGEKNVIAMKTLTDVRRRCDPSLFSSSLQMPLAETVLPRQDFDFLRKRKRVKSSG